MIFDQANLPLNFRKVIKKSIGSFSPFIIFTTFGIVEINSGQYRTLGIITLCLAVLMPIFQFIYQYFYYKTYAYTFEDDGASITKGVIARATGHIQYRRLQNIYIDQDFWDRVFGLYDVHYESAGEKSGFYSHVDGLIKENADKLSSFLVLKSKGDSGPTTNSNIEPLVNPVISTSQTLPIQDSGSITRTECPILRSVIWVNTLGASMLFFIFAAFFIFPFVIPVLFMINLILMFIVILLIPVAIISFFYAYYTIWYKNFYFSFGTDKGEIRTKVIGQSTSYLYYNRIQNINVAQNFIERIFGTFSLYIETAGETSGMKFNLTGLSQEGAEKIREFLLSRSKLYKNTL